MARVSLVHEAVLSQVVVPNSGCELLSRTSACCPSQSQGRNAHAQQIIILATSCLVSDQRKRF